MVATTYYIKHLHRPSICPQGREVFGQHPEPHFPVQESLRFHSWDRVTAASSWIENRLESCLRVIIYKHRWKTGIILIKPHLFIGGKSVVPSNKVLSWKNSLKILPRNFHGTVSIGAVTLRNRCRLCHFDFVSPQNTSSSLHIGLKRTEFVPTGYNNLLQKTSVLCFFHDIATLVVFPVENDQPTKKLLKSNSGFNRFVNLFS